MARKKTTQAADKPKRSRREWLEPTMWKKGQSGNPKGRQKGKTFTAALRELLDRVDPKTGEDGYERLAAIFIQEARRKKFSWAREIMERIDGRVPLRVTGANDGPVEVEVDVADLRDRIARRLAAQGERGNAAPDPGRVDRR